MTYTENEKLIDDNGLNELKPTAKVVGHLDILGKYKSDLEYLKNGKLTIERQMVESNIDDAAIDKKLKKLNDAINQLEDMIEKYKKEYGL